MMSTELLVDAFARIHSVVHRAVEGMTPDQLMYRPDSQANSVAWLVWHLTRVQDDHVADVAGRAQVWISQDWAGKFGLPFAATATGYGDGPDDVSAVRVQSGDLLLGYHDAVFERTVDYVEGLTDNDFDRIVDAAWDPPVSLGVRLISVISDDLQHAGQAAYLRGLGERRS